MVWSEDGALPAMIIEAPKSPLISLCEKKEALAVARFSSSLRAGAQWYHNFRCSDPFDPIRLRARYTGQDIATMIAA